MFPSDITVVAGDHGRYCPADQRRSAAECRAQAHKLRALGEAAQDAEVRRELFGIALRYERMAAFIERTRMGK